MLLAKYAWFLISNDAAQQKVGEVMERERERVSDRFGERERWVEERVSPSGKHTKVDRVAFFHSFLLFCETGCRYTYEEYA